MRSNRNARCSLDSLGSEPKQVGKMVSIRLFNFEAALRHLTATGSCSTVRSYAMVPRTHAPPIIRKEEQEQFLSENMLDIPHFVKPALASDTSSEFFDETIRKFTNCIMRHGKKTLARKLVADTLTMIKITQLKKYHAAPDDKKSFIELDPKKIMVTAIENCKPVLGTCKVRRGGINYTVPLPIKERRSNFLGMKFLIEAGQNKHRKQHFAETLTKDILEAFQNSGRAIQRKQQLHRVCDENRAYAHYRWLNQGKKMH